MGHWRAGLSTMLALTCACLPREDGEPRDAGPPPERPPDVDAGPAPPTYLQITFDYRFDDRAFFTAEKRAVLEEAAAIWGRLLVDDFAPVPAGTPVLTRDPEDPDAPAATLALDGAIDDVLVFVGAASLDGRGGQTARSFPSATLEVDDEALAAELSARYDDDDFSPWTGWISFDAAEDWFVDESPRTAGDLPSSRYDLLSTATHELAHVLGFGTAPAFFALAGGGVFSGARAAGVYGGPVPLAGDGAHFASDVVVGGAPPLMDASDPLGARFAPTALDVAALADVGYQPLEP